MRKKNNKINRMFIINISFLFFGIITLGFCPVLTKCIDFYSSFTEIGSIAPETDIINACYIDNELAFLAEINRGFFVYDITDPANCVELDRYNIINFIHDLHLDTERKLVFVTASNGVNILDISDPSNLELHSVYKNYTSSTFIQMMDELLFIGAEDAGLQIVNVSDSYNPTWINSWEDSEGDIGPVYVLEDYEYDDGEGGTFSDDFAFIGIRIPNVDAPPTPIATRVLNISDPLNISLVSTVHTDDGPNDGVPRVHDSERELLYLPDYDNGLKILNFSDPSNVNVLGVYLDDSIINDVTVVDEAIAFLADDSFGLKIVNCSDPENPFLIGSYSHEWRTLRVAVEENRIYMATIDGGVRILSAEQERKIPFHPIFILGSIAAGIWFLWFRVTKSSKK